MRDNFAEKRKNLRRVRALKKLLLNEVEIPHGDFELDFGKDYSIYELIVPQDSEKGILLIENEGIRKALDWAMEK